jgi:large conductance mechanosensitive channel
LVFKDSDAPLVKTVTATSYAEAKAQGAVIGYGQFLTISINFLIVAWVLFMVIKAVNKLRRQAAPPVPAPATLPEDVALLREIRDLLARQKP